MPVPGIFVMVILNRVGLNLTILLLFFFYFSLSVSSISCKTCRIIMNNLSSQTCIASTDEETCTIQVWSALTWIASNFLSRHQPRLWPTFHGAPVDVGAVTKLPTEREFCCRSVWAKPGKDCTFVI